MITWKHLRDASSDDNLRLMARILIVVELSFENQEV